MAGATRRRLSFDRDHLGNDHIDQTLEFFGITTPIGGRVPGIPTPEYLDRIRAALDIAEG